MWRATHTMHIPRCASSQRQVQRGKHKECMITNAARTHTRTHAPQPQPVSQTCACTPGLTMWRLSCQHRLLGAARRHVAQVIDGKGVAAAVRRDIKREVELLVQRHGRPPGLAVVLVGDRQDSSKYVAMKKRAADEVGIMSFDFFLPPTVMEREVVELVLRLNRDDRVDGILVQLPLPDHMDPLRVINAIDVMKDVDGFHHGNMGTLTQLGEEMRRHCASFSPGSVGNAPCTPLGA